MSAASRATVEVRRATAADDPAVLALLQASLGWVPDEQHARFFAWKHRENPAGASPTWVATDGGEVVGFRSFLRWPLAVDAEPVEAVRAVDTATAPSSQGRGIFTTLTLHALDELHAAGTAYVFNTPNDRSRPGYLKMGWQPVGRLPVRARPRSLGGARRLVGARTSADRWSLPTAAGVAVDEALAEAAAVRALLGSLPTDGVRTALTREHLAWRYGFAPLAYRALVAPGGTGAGLVVFRLRRRGSAVEAAVCEELVPGGDARTTRRLLTAVLRRTGADYVLRLGRHLPRAGSLPVSGAGPLLVWRGVAEERMPAADRWRLGLGDVELL